MMKVIHILTPAKQGDKNGLIIMGCEKSISNQLIKYVSLFELCGCITVIDFPS